VTPGLAGFADDRPGAAGTAAGGDHTNRQAVIMVVLLGPRHRTVRSFEGWNKGGCVV